VSSTEDKGEVAGLIGAVALEQTDKWIESRRYIGLEVLAKVDELLTQDMGATDMPVGTTDELEPVELAMT